jgi:hypothetical protein
MAWLSSITNNAQHSRLFQLPAEIRELIFEHALISPKSLVAFRLEDEYQRADYHEAVQPPLTFVSRQLRRECLPIFYSSNDIVLHTESSKVNETQAWLRCAEKHLPTLRRISILVRYTSLTGYFRGRSASGATRLWLQRAEPGDRWNVSEQWRWTTVTRPPVEVEFDAKFLIKTLKMLLADNGGDFDNSESFGAALVDLRMLYVKEKMS